MNYLKRIDADGKPIQNLDKLSLRNRCALPISLPRYPARASSPCCKVGMGTQLRVPQGGERRILEQCHTGTWFVGLLTQRVRDREKERDTVGSVEGREM